MGAWAVSIYGQPRYTGDLDIFIRKSSENADRLLSALSDFGFGSVGFSKADFLKSNSVIQLGYEPNRIDILTDISGVDFDKAWQKRELVKSEGLEIPFISRKHLIENKKAIGRAKDLADIENLEKHRRLGIDR